jgi:ABC-type transport system involved in multi-copper enzyme maturation permease subunit
MSQVNTFSPTAAALPESSAASTRFIALNNIQAISGVVIKELYRRKDFYVLFILTALITLVFGSVNFFNEEKIVRSLKEICLFLIWGASLVIAITTTARQIPAEREHRTIFPLLAKPVTRNDLILGKFWGCWQASGLTLLVFYAFFIAISGLREHEWPLVSYFQGMVLHWFLLGVIIAMTMLGSIVFAAPSSNSTILFVVTAGIMLLARHLNKLALQMEEPSQSLVYALYYAIPHLELFDVRDLLVHNLLNIPWPIWLGALVYAIFYGALFLTGACIAFRRKAVN